MRACVRACVHARTRSIPAAVLARRRTVSARCLDIECVLRIQRVFLSLVLTGHVQEEPDEYLLLQDLIALHRRGVQDVRYTHTHTHTHTHNPNAHTQRETHRTNTNNLHSNPKPRTLSHSPSLSLTHSITILTDDEPYPIESVCGHAGRFFLCFPLCSCSFWFVVHSM